MGSVLRAKDGLLAQGTVIGDGRFRLLDPVGVDSRDNANLWRARDGQLNRDVALTILSGNSSRPDAVRHTLQRAAPASRFLHPGIAPVLNVLSVGDGVARDEGVAGIIAAEWTRGTGMTDLVAPVTPAHACMLLDPLAEAMGRAHRRGVMLGVGNPLRVRVGPSGTLRLAFPGPPAGMSLIDDVRGLGAILYVLLTGSWPAADGRIAPPRELQPEVPADLSDVTVRSLAGDIRTSDSILSVLRQPPTNAAPLPVTGKSDTEWTTKPPVNDTARKKKLAIGVAALVLISIAIVVWLGVTVISTFL
jgi:hypothetical protein